MTDLEQEEMVWRITRQYVAEVCSGVQPQLRNYLARYPQYASEIADFIAYYQEFEVYSHDEDNSAYVPPDRSRQNILTNLLQQVHTSFEPLESLLLTGSEASVLAQELDLSEDVLLLLDRHLILQETLPGCLIENLALVLHQPKSAVRSYLRRVPTSEKYRNDAHLRVVAEEPGFYAQNSFVLPIQSFLQALEESSLATIEQKQRWRLIVERDQGEKNAKNSLS